MRYIKLAQFRKCWTQKWVKKVVLYSCILIKGKVAFKPKLTLRGEGTHY